MRLVHQRPAAIELPGAAPLRAGIVLGRTVPADAAAIITGLPSSPSSSMRLISDDVGPQPILEEHAELHAGGRARVDQFVGARRRDVEGLLGEHVKAVARRRDSLLGVKPDGLPMATMSIGRWARNLSRSS
jgi:hypothetical protein